MSDAGCLVLVISLGAVILDFRFCKIPNCWLLSGWAAAFWYQVCHPAGAGIGVFLSGSVLPLLLLGILFLFRMLGAGDLKLLAVLGAFLGSEAVFWCIVWSVLFGAVFSILIMSVCGIWLQRLQYFLAYLRNFIQTGSRVPYRSAQFGQENLHFSAPILLAVLLWTGGFY